jgi:flagellar M-ring protein FliF
MPAIDMEKLKAGGQRFVSGFTTGQKFVTAIALTFLLVGGWFFSQWESTPRMASLYTDLDPADASDVTQELDSTGVAYELTDGGRTIMVPRDDVYSTRIALSGQGLPAGGDSYALLDEGGITESEFSQRIDYQRALQGELAKTLMAMDGIDAATVNLTLPRDEIFVDDESPRATAAVLVRTRSGFDPSNEQVESMVHLVSSSVPDLLPEAVTITNQEGTLLKARGESEIGGAGSRNEEQILAAEQVLTDKINDMLNRALGPGMATVGVTVEMDFTETTREQREVTPSGRNGQNLVSEEQLKAEEFAGSGEDAAGTLGPDGEAPATGADSGDDYTSEESRRKYDPNVTLTNETLPPGRITRKSVSVMIDDSALTATDLPQYERNIAAAALIDEEGRGDQLQVSLVKMAALPDADEALEAIADPASDGMAGAIRYVATLLIIALVLFFAWRGVKKSQLALAPVRVPIDLAELEAAESAMPALPSAEAIANELEAANFDLPALADSQVSPMEREISSLIEQQPEDVAQTLRSWLADRRS